MKYLFMVIAALLGLSSVAIRLSYPDLSSPVPVIYWATDPNPARVAQVNGFHRWQVANGHATQHTYADEAEASSALRALPTTLLDDVVWLHPPLAALLPEVADALLRAEPSAEERLRGAAPLVWPMTVQLPLAEMRTDAANSDATKKVIQTVSGVGSDVMDLGGGKMMRQFVAMGVLADLTDHAGPMGFGLDKTYESLASELTVHGRQYMFPCNVAFASLWVNIDTFRKLGMEPPPTRWTLDEFERMGVEFCDRANAGRSRRTIFFADSVNSESLRRSAGVSVFNETLSASRLNQPRHAEVLERTYRWVYDLNILPTPDDLASAATAQGYGGQQLQLFGSGQYGMVSGGRWLLIQFREFQNLGPLAFVESPSAGFPNVIMGTRAAGVYVATKHPHESKLFLAYLASSDYNQQIVNDADALPPNPLYTRTQAFLNPTQFPNEAGTHGEFVRQVEEIGIANEITPFVVPTVVDRIVSDVSAEFNVGRRTAAQAVEKMQVDIDREIVRSVQRKPELAEQFRQAQALQELIDQRHSQGLPIPENWIDNPFLLAYYKHTGQLTAPQPRP